MVALAQCRDLMTRLPTGLGGLYDLYAARVEAFRQNPPPPDWDGVYIALSK
jgi:adenylate cyclase